MDPLTIIMLVVLALLIIFMFRNSKKRQKAAAELKEQIVPGVEIMTTQGVYGTLVSIDEETNQILVESTPGTVLRLHRQSIGRVVDPVRPDLDGSHDDLSSSTDQAGTEPELNQDHAEPLADPTYGERLGDADPKSGKKADD
ncbi:MAG: preprotein translocase subunit YajC [Microbacteriaceae bacterium]